ncbi:MAG: hypothetical protein ACD_80C00084G0017 [uncultured bacterium (gcode 4)]|uniref:Uncharacterized protein n=1 Tax=uncultured bacterium (gcode 4) TaxID=1234023 RepID=K1XJG3_9BACT|nr:MAG: hypothetical protein ACD_80C00084G0017 [uncultured bacterium (gcode 4)]HBB04929.1 hypothetical protein [Candidatus Gracilibacteria bacterium]
MKNVNFIKKHAAAKNNPVEYVIHFRNSEHSSVDSVEWLNLHFSMTKLYTIKLWIEIDDINLGTVEFKTQSDVNNFWKSADIENNKKKVQTKEKIQKFKHHLDLDKITKQLPFETLIMIITTHFPVVWYGWLSKK